MKNIKLNRSVLKLFTLFLMVGAAVFLQTDKTSGAAVAGCDTDFSECIYSCAMTTSGLDFYQCKNTCDQAWEICAIGDPTNPSGGGGGEQPLPVQDNRRSICSQGCMDIYGIDPIDFDDPRWQARMDCYNACSVYPR